MVRTHTHIHFYLLLPSHLFLLCPCKHALVRYIVLAPPIPHFFFFFSSHTTYILSMSSTPHFMYLLFFIVIVVEVWWFTTLGSISVVTNHIQSIWFLACPWSLLIVSLLLPLSLIVICYAYKYMQYIVVSIIMNMLLLVVAPICGNAYDGGVLITTLCV